ncbi:MAG TPA: DUF488 domain-containing protein [Candidatus Saccharimonadales bacterium]|nr:DUF488 domain-containing protein [Candidatus Saccharimonadales bacterium]
MRIYTIGHSTRPIDEFVELLKTNDVTQLIDIRTIPKSRHNPQFAQDNLQQTLPASDIEYRYMKNLGGLRPTSKDSINCEWRNKSFRGYADYMQTPDFAQTIDELISYAANKTTAIMCAEAVPWRCHRSLVGDALVVRDIEVIDMMSLTSNTPHTLTSFAAVDGTRVYYPPTGTSDTSK